MSLDQLPTEVLRMILSDDCLASYDLTRLARVNKNIRSIVLEALYKHVNLRIFGFFRCIIHEESRKFVLFRRTVCDSPEIAALIQSITVECEVLPDWSNFHINHLLGKLDSLRALNLGIYGGMSHFNPTFLEENPRIELRRLEIYDHFLTFDDLARYMFLPNIKDIKARSTIGAANYTTIVPSVYEHKSFLTTLEIRIASNVVRALLNLLSSCRALQRFTCDISDIEHLPPGFARSRPMSRAGLCQALRHCRQTMIILEVKCGPRLLYGYDSSVFDLSSFENLRILIVSGGLLFSRNEKYNIPVRDHFYDRLPSSLEALQVRFSILIPNSQIYLAL
jgi:hypothetical protein